MIGNPGFGTSVSDFEAFGHPPTTKAIRNYKGLEITLDKRFSNKLVRERFVSKKPLIR
jgi:hypothetical protein